MVTGMGVVSPCGQTTTELFSNVIHARSGIAHVPADLFPTPNSLVAGYVAPLPDLGQPARPPTHVDRSTLFALEAVRQAIADAELPLADEALRRAGVYWGTGLGGASSIEEAYRLLFVSERGRLRPTTVVLGMSNSSAAFISLKHGFRGPQLNISTACASSAMSIGEAARAIRHGYADVIVAGGSEALLTFGNITSWEAMHALAHADPADASRSCKPFSADRTGLVLGEGAAAVVLESESHARSRGARIHGVVTGYGNSGDASSMSRPDADGQVRAIRMALTEAGRETGEVDYLNAHGTGTQAGDAIETAAIKSAFGAQARDLCISSTKALHGHLLGAAGALEAVICLMALAHKVVPPTAHLDRPDPECDLDYVPNVARERQLRVVMSNSFAFGGMNAVLILEAYA
ncbi:MAG: beta-ketoacyl-[acyl-carrier-protein] synthase family protein [Acidobacteriota bacterium]